MGMRDDHRPRRPAHGENTDQPSTILELPVKPIRNDLGRPGKDNHVIGRIGLIAVGGSLRS